MGNEVGTTVENLALTEGEAVVMAAVVICPVIFQVP